jgi:hypothetical protein
MRVGMSARSRALAGGRRRRGQVPRVRMHDFTFMRPMSHDCGSKRTNLERGPPIRARAGRSRECSPASENRPKSFGDVRNGLQEGLDRLNGRRSVSSATWNSTFGESGPAQGKHCPHVGVSSVPPAVALAHAACLLRLLPSTGASVRL